MLVFEMEAGKQGVRGVSRVCGRLLGARGERWRCGIVRRRGCVVLLYFG